MDCAVVQLYQFFGQGEANSAALGFSGAGIVNLIEAVEDLIQPLLGDADAGVRNNNIYDFRFRNSELPPLTKTRIDFGIGYIRACGGRGNSEIRIRKS